MKIGIYGDSYAHAHYPEIATCWFKLLEKQLNATSHVYSKPASSLYFSYKNYIETHHLYDLNIFLVTSPCRYTKPVELTKSKYPYYLTSIEQIDYMESNYELEPEDFIKLKSIRGWFESVDVDYENDIFDLMLDKIESTRNTIIVPCGSTSFNQARFDKYELDMDLHTLHSIWVRQRDLLGLEPNIFLGKEKEILCGHLSPEWNIFFANVLYKRITTGKWDYSGFYDVKMEHPANYYYYL